jgi:hypothetical protein
VGVVKNGALPALIEREGFQAFLTGDKSMETQQRLEGRPLAVLVCPRSLAGDPAARS